MTVSPLSVSEPGRIPEEIERAIEEHQRWSILLGGLTAGATFKVQEARVTLDAAILSQLNGIERKAAWLDWMLRQIGFNEDGSERDSGDGHDWPAIVREALEVRDPVLLPVVAAQLSAALARAERLEKALEVFTDPQLTGLVFMPAKLPVDACPPPYTIHAPQLFEAARAALGFLVPDEERKHGA